MRNTQPDRIDNEIPYLKHSKSIHREIDACLSNQTMLMNIDK